MAKQHSDETDSHKSFRLSRRGDYRRAVEMPGIIPHVAETFEIVRRNYKVFLGIVAVGAVAAILLVGLMSQQSYRALQGELGESAVAISAGRVGGFALAWLSLVPTLLSGGISEQSSESGAPMMFLIFLVIWLATMYVARGTFMGQKVKLGDAIYKSGAPLMSTLVVLGLILLECLPIVVLMAVYAAAISTEFLAMPFYALMFLGFAAAMVAISCYLLPDSIMALVAVSAPGLYPIKALSAAHQMMAGQKFSFLVRVVALVLILFLIGAGVMLPIIALDAGLKNFAWAESIPIVPFFALILTCFLVIFAAVYLYIYYRWMIGYEKN